MNKPKLWTKDFIIATWVNFCTAIAFYLLMVVISGYAMSEYDSSPSEAGFAASIFLIGGLIARLSLGKWITQIGYKRALVLGIALSLLMTLLYFGASSLFLLLIFRFLHGVGFGITTTATATIVSIIIPKKRGGEGIGYFGLSQILATAVGPFIGLLLSRHGSFGLIFAVSAIAPAISLAVSPFLSLPEMELTEEQSNEMKGLRFSNFFEPKVIPISIISLLTYICFSSVLSFLAVYSQKIHLVNAAGFFFIVFAIAMVISRPVIGRLFDMKGENSVMYPSIIVFTLGMALFSQAYYGAILLSAGVLIGIGVGAIQSSTQAISVKITPRHRLGLASSTYYASLDIGMGLGPLMAGFMIPLIGYHEMYMVVAILGALCLLLYYLLHGRQVIETYAVKG